MKSTLKRELKGLEVVKMETNGFSTEWFVGESRGGGISLGVMEGESRLVHILLLTLVQPPRYFAPHLVSMGAV